MVNIKSWYTMLIIKRVNKLEISLDLTIVFSKYLKYLDP